MASYDRAFPRDPAESTHEPLCDYELNTVRETIDTKPSRPPKRKFEPNPGRYFQPENGNVQPKFPPKMNRKQKREVKKAKKAEKLNAPEFAKPFQKNNNGKRNKKKKPKQPNINNTQVGKKN